jgi:hypothetical protein
MFSNDDGVDPALAGFHPARVEMPFLSAVLKVYSRQYHPGPKRPRDSSVDGAYQPIAFLRMLVLKQFANYFTRPLSCYRFCLRARREGYAQ